MNNILNKIQNILEKWYNHYENIAHCNIDPTESEINELGKYSKQLFDSTDKVCNISAILYTKQFVMGGEKRAKCIISKKCFENLIIDAKAYENIPINTKTISFENYNQFESKCITKFKSQEISICYILPKDDSKNRDKPIYIYLKKNNGKYLFDKITTYRS